MNKLTQNYVVQQSQDDANGVFTDVYTTTILDEALEVLASDMRMDRKKGRKTNFRVLSVIIDTRKENEL